MASNKEKPQVEDSQPTTEIDFNIPPALSTRAAKRAQGEKTDDDTVVEVIMAGEDSGPKEHRADGLEEQKFAVLLKVMMLDPMGTPPARHAWDWRIITDVVSGAVAEAVAPVKEVIVLDRGTCYVLFGGRKTGGLTFAEAGQVCQMMNGAFNWVGKPAEIEASPRPVNDEMRMNLAKATKLNNAKAALAAMEAKPKTAPVTSTPEKKRELSPVRPFQFTAQPQPDAHTETESEYMTDFSVPKAKGFAPAARLAGKRRPARRKKLPSIAENEKGNETSFTESSGEESNFENHNTSTHNSNRMATQQRPREKRQLTKMKIPSFNGISTGNGCSYRLWRSAIFRWKRANYSDDQILAEAFSTLKGEPAELVQDLGEDATLDEMMEVLDGHYGNVLDYDALNSELYTMKQAFSESVTAFGVRVSTCVKMMAAEYPARMPAHTVPTTKRDRFYGGLRPVYKNALAYLREKRGVTYEKVLSKAREIEISRNLRDPGQQEVNQTPAAKQNSYRKNDQKGRPISVRTARTEEMVAPAEEDDEPLEEEEEGSNKGVQKVLDSLNDLEGVPLTHKSMAAVIGELQKQQGMKQLGPRLLCLWGSGSPCERLSQESKE